MFSKLGFILAIFTSISAHAAYAPALAPTIQGGFGTTQGSSIVPLPAASMPLSSISSRVTLFFGKTSSTNNNYYNASMLQGGGYYRGNPTKTTYCYNMQYSTGAAIGATFGYGDTVSDDSSSAPTNPFYYSAATGTSSQARVINYGNTSSAFDSWPIFMTFPASKYPFVLIASAGAAFGFVLDCIEQ